MEKITGTEGERDLVKYLRQHSGSFCKGLFDLIVKADNSNLRRIGEGFPDHVRAWKLKQEMGEREFLEAYDAQNK